MGKPQKEQKEQKEQNYQACKDCEFYLWSNRDGYSEPFCINSNIAIQQFDKVQGWKTKLLLCREYRAKHNVCAHYNKTPNKWYQFWRTG